MKKQKKPIGLIACISVCFIFVFCLAGLYVYQVGELTESGYLIKEYKREIAKKSTDNIAVREYLLEFPEIEKELAEAGFIPSGNIIYISLAQKRLSRAEF